MKIIPKADRRLCDRRAIARCNGLLFVVVAPLILGIGLERSTSGLDTVLVFSLATGWFLGGLWAIHWGNRGLWWSGGRKVPSKEPLFDKSLDELAGKNDVPADWIARVRSELRPGERLTWIGQPRPAHFVRQAFSIVVFGAIWTAFCLIFATFTVLITVCGGVVTGSPVGMWLMIGIFLLIGLALLSSPYWQWRKAKRTCYALTDRRAILWEAGSFGSVEIRSYEPDDLTEMYRVEYPGGGDLVFEEIDTVRQDSDGEQTTVTKHRGFLGVENVREVEEFLRRTLLKLDD